MKLRDLLKEAGGEKAGKLDVDRTSSAKALEHLKSETDTTGKDWEGFLETFEKNYDKLKSLAAKGHTKRKDMPVVGSKQIGELQQRLEQGKLDIIDHKTRKFHNNKAFPSGLSGKKADEWLEKGLHDGDLKDDIFTVRKTSKQVGSLTPIQGQIYAEIPIDMVVRRGVAGAVNYVSKQSLIIVSKDGYILDGHHRWAAGVLLDPKLTIPCMVVDIPKKKLIDILLSYGDAIGNARNG